MTYQAAFDKIVADLQLEAMPITLRLEWRKTLRRNDVGWCAASSHSAEITVAADRSEASVIETIAHELRHAWQRRNNIALVATVGKTSHHAWSGTPFAPTPKTWRKIDYWNNPTEVDARGYAAEAVRRLFGLLPDEEATTPTLDDFFLVDAEPATKRPTECLPADPQFAGLTDTWLTTLYD